MSLHLHAQNGWTKQESLFPLPTVFSEAIQQGSEMQEWIKLKKELWKFGKSKTGNWLEGADVRLEWEIQLGRQPADGKEGEKLKK